MNGIEYFTNQISVWTPQIEAGCGSFNMLSLREAALLGDVALLEEGLVRGSVTVEAGL